MASNLSGGENCSDYVHIDEDRATELIYTSTQVVITTAAIPIILCLGVITNSSFLFVVIRTPKIKSHTTLYLAHLAVADLLYLISSASFQIWRWRVSPVIVQTPFVTATQCVMYDMVIDLGYLSSVPLVSMSAYERFLSLCHPLTLHRIQRRRRTYKLIALCWLVGLIFACVNTIFGYQITAYHCQKWPDDDKYLGLPSTFKQCEFANGKFHDITRLIMSILMHIVVGLNTYMYIRIICDLNKRRGSTEGLNTDAWQIQNRVTKMVVVNGVVFFVCQTPYQTLTAYTMTASFLGSPSSGMAVLHWTGRLLLYVNSSVNPLIYNAMNPMYRAALLAVCGCKRPDVSSHIPTSLSAVNAPTTSHGLAPVIVNIETNV